MRNDPENSWSGQNNQQKQWFHQEISIITHIRNFPEWIWKSSGISESFLGNFFLVYNQDHPHNSIYHLLYLYLLNMSDSLASSDSFAYSMHMRQTLICPDCNNKVPEGYYHEEYNLFVCAGCITKLLSRTKGTKIGLYFYIY